MICMFVSRSSWYFLVLFDTVQMMIVHYYALFRVAFGSLFLLYGYKRLVQILQYLALNPTRIQTQLHLLPFVTDST